PCSSRDELTWRRRFESRIRNVVIPTGSRGQPNSLSGIPQSSPTTAVRERSHLLEQSAEQAQIPEAQPSIPTFADGGHLTVEAPRRHEMVSQSGRSFEISAPLRDQRSTPALLRGGAPIAPPERTRVSA